MDSLTYPAAPAGATDDILKTSAGFRREVRMVIASLVGFSLLYLVLLLFSLFLLFAFGVIAFLLVGVVRHWLAIIFGLGLVIAGLMTTFFVIKFLFSRSKSDRSELTEITEQEYPELFAFIRRVSEETNTPFPKRIYLSPEVNASVFYDSTFWSMFLPVKKNLVIGLGLVNMLNISEFKSVIAHEFGHFSQKSMKAGSFVYQANKIIYNLLYENAGYASALQSWGNSHYLFALCARITEVFVTSIQSILQSAYKAINKQYLRLSREMEYHADAMSVKVAGANNAIQALRRIEFADACYNGVIGRYNEWVADNVKGRNLYSQQRIMAEVTAKELGFSFSGSLPVLDDPDKHYKNYNRVSIADQWTSHPTREQREAAMNAFGVNGPVVEDSPWQLFGEASRLQEEITGSLYRNVQFEHEPDLLDDRRFEEKILESRRKYSYPDFYAGYYNGRDISVFDTETAARPLREIADIKAFFKDKSELSGRIAGSRQDIQLLGQISEEKSGVKTFDFDGEKYKTERAAEVISAIQASLAAWEQELKDSDLAAYCYFLEQGDTNASAKLKAMYTDYFKVLETEQQFIQASNDIARQMQPFYENQTEGQDTALIESCSVFGRKIKEAEQVLRQNPLASEATLPANLLSFDQEHWYFLTTDKNFDGNKLNILMGYVNRFAGWLYEMSFCAQKALLEEQLKRLNA